MDMLPDEEFYKLIAWSKVVAGCVIRNDDGKYLLVQEGQPKVYGQWNVTAGHVDKGESIEAAAIREAKEETGLDVEIVEKLGVWHESVESPVFHLFNVRVLGGKIKPENDEILDVGWFSYDEIVKLNDDGKFRSPWVFEGLTKFEERF